jgi:hypothetical protein
MANYQQNLVANKRVRFYDGQYLQDQDFIDEQKYHVDRERRHQRLLHVAGVVEGLLVTPAVQPDPQQPYQITVSPGTAIDHDGRTIVLEANATIALPGLADSLLYLYIAYGQVPSDTQTSSQGVQQDMRWHERPYIFSSKDLIGESNPGYTNPDWSRDVEERPSLPPPVLLARLSLDAEKKNIVPDLTVRQYSGLRLPLPDRVDDSPMLRADSDGNIGVWTSGADRKGPTKRLTITQDGNVGIGVPYPKLALEVNGSLSVNGALTVNGALATLNKGLTVSGNASITSLDTGAGLTIDRGNTNNLALAVTSTGPGWGSGMQFQNTTTGAKTFGIYAGSDAKWHFSDQSAQVDRMIVDPNGNVGIGTAEPLARLQINATTDNGGGSQLRAPEQVLRLWRDGIVYQAWPNIAAFSLSRYELRADTAARTRLDIGLSHGTSTEITTIMSVRSDGNVGIGTTTPNAKLDVWGDVCMGVDAQRRLVASGAFESTRIVRGRLIHFSSGQWTKGGYDFELTSLGSGICDIHFTPPFADVPAVVVAQEWGNAGDAAVVNTLDNCTIVALNEEVCRIKCGASDGRGTDRNFHFIAIGRR